jgi:hypothetical protein
MGGDHQGQRREHGLIGFGALGGGNECGRQAVARHGLPLILRLHHGGRTALRYLIGLSIAWAMLTPPGSPASAQQGPFRFQEATIASIHAALAAGQVTCTQLTRLYLDRIAATP